MTRPLSATIGAMTLLLALLATAPAMARTLEEERSEIAKIVSWPYVTPTRSPGVPVREWTWRLAIPQPNQPRKPLVIVLHGNSINANLAILSTGFNLHDFHVVGMNASTEQNERCDLAVFIPGQKCMAFTLNSEDDKVASDDGEAIVHYIEQAKRNPLIDSSRIYVFGESGGGFVLLRNLCKLAGKVAAVGVSGALPRVKDTQHWTSSKDCSPGVAIPYVHVHGTADKNVPYRGVDADGSEFNQWGRFIHPGAEAAVYFMAQRNKTNYKEVWNLPDRSPTDSVTTVDAGTNPITVTTVPKKPMPTTVTSTTHYANGVPMVRLLKVNGGGHLMPNLFPNYPKAQGLAITNRVAEGPVNLDIVGADEIAKFFMLHKLD